MTENTEERREKRRRKYELSFNDRPTMRVTLSRLKFMGDPQPHDLSAWAGGKPMTKRERGHNGPARRGGGWTTWGNRMPLPPPPKALDSWPDHETKSLAEGLLSRLTPSR
jgi:hypothetical protein